MVFGVSIVLLRMPHAFELELIERCLGDIAADLWTGSKRRKCIDLDIDIDRYKE